MKSLQRQLTEVKREKEEELQQRNEMIAHLKVIHSFHYRPQTKLRKVMFSHLSVSHSVHGGACIQAHNGQGVVYHSMQLGGCLPLGPGGVHPAGKYLPPKQTPPPG